MAIIKDSIFKIEMTEMTEILSNKLHSKSLFEKFKLKIFIKNKPIINENIQILSGNITNLIKVLTEEEKFDVDFIEPKINIKLKPIQQDLYLFQFSINKGNWNDIYSQGEVNFKLEITKSDLNDFNNQLKKDWKYREKAIC